jgi:hypothetical protein
LKKIACKSCISIHFSKTFFFPKHPRQATTLKLTTPKENEGRDSKDNQEKDKGLIKVLTTIMEKNGGTRSSNDMDWSGWR